MKKFLLTTVLGKKSSLALDITMGVAVSVMVIVGLLS